MEFLELNREEYQDFAYHHPLKSFFQTVQMETLSNYGGWKSDYVGVKENNQIIAATRLVSYKNRLGFSYFYAPRGLLLDYKNRELLAFFTRHLKKYIKKKKGYVLKIDPTIVHLERDSDGNVIENGVNNEWCVEYLKHCGYIHQGYTVGYDETSQCRWVYCLDLKGKTEEEILKNMKQTTRNQIKKTLKYGIRIRELKYEELSIFKAITEEASKRNHFHDKTLEYYRHMYQIFKPTNEIQYLVAELDTKLYLETLEEELKSWEMSLQKLSDHPRNEGKKKELQVSIDATKKRMKQIVEISKKGEIIPIAAAMFMLYGDEIIYYHSGNYKEYIEFNGQMMIQWHMIKYGLEHHFKRYNFFGISGDFHSPKEKGVYEFKKGFGGYVEEYIGDFNLPVHWYYYVQKLFHHR